MCSVNYKMEETRKKVEKPPPEGGWGYCITLSVFLVHLTTVIPFTIFGIIFGDFFTSLGNETSGTTLSLSIALCCSCSTGLLASFLLEKYSFRFVGLLGACIQSVSYISVLFANNLPLFIFCFSILGGLGGGLMIPATFSSLNDYFHKKLNLVTAVAQILITVCTMIYPLAAAYAMENFGFFNTKLILAAISSLSFFAMWMLHPVEWHIKNFEGRELLDKNQSGLNKYQKPLLKDEGYEKIEMPVEIVKSSDDKEKKVAALSFLKSPKYLNLILGISLGFTSDNLFVGFLRLVLNNLGFDIFDIATMTMVHFACDLISRIVYVVVSAFYPIKNRYVFFTGSLITVIFRIAFVLRDDYTWRVTHLAILGFARCCIQIPFSLAIAEEYREHFATAFSLFMMISGLISLVLGQLANLAKSMTNSDTMCLQVLTVAIAITVISWSIEFTYRSFKKK